MGLVEGLIIGLVRSRLWIVWCMDSMVRLYWKVGYGQDWSSLNEHGTVA